MVYQGGNSTATIRLSGVCPKASGTVTRLWDLLGLGAVQK